MTLGDAFPVEIARVRALADLYHSIGLAGAFAAAWIDALIVRAEKAQAEGDVVAMVQLYSQLEACE